MNSKLYNALSITWKMGLGFFGLAALTIGIILAIVWYKESYGRDYFFDYTLTPNVRIEAYNNNRVRVWNKKTARYTTPKVMWVSGVPERDSLTVFCDKDGKRGFLNVNTGDIVIPAQYNKAWQFSEGLGAVLGEKDKIGFIDKDNRLVIDYVIPYEKGYDYIFKDGLCVVKFWEGNDWRYAVYGKDGNMVLSWNYNRIDEPDARGYRVVANEDGAWLFDRNFQKVLPDTYDNMELARGNNGVYVTKNHVKQLLDFEGRVLEPFVIDRTYSLNYLVKYHEDESDEYETAQDVLAYQVDNWDGLMDARTGKILTPAIYWNLEMISRDLIRAKLGHGDEYVLLDRRGREVKQ